MRCVTWSKDSHGLFDYESRHISKKNIKSFSQGKIVRIDNEVEFVSAEVEALHQAQPLLQITQNENSGTFFVKNDTLSQNTE